MLIQLPELPVHREDVHVVVLLEVPDQQFHGMVASLQALLILVDLFHLWEQRCCVTKGPGRLSGPVKVPSPRQEARVGRDQPKSGFGMREGGPGVKTVLPLQGHRFDPCQGPKIPHAEQSGQEKKDQMREGGG